MAYPRIQMGAQKQPKQVSFKASKAEYALVSQIVDRFKKQPGTKAWDALSLNMDLIACNANGCPLDFERLLAADDFNLAHDVAGIGNHIDRETGQLTRCFLPRFAKREVTA